MANTKRPVGESRPPTGLSIWLLGGLCGLAIAVFIAHPWSLTEKLFALAYGLDPQRPSHTYILGGVQLPLEARKLGMFGGFLLTGLSLLAAGRWRAAAFPPRPVAVTLAAFIAVMGLDGANATFYDLGWPHLYTPDLRLRLATGLLAGLAMAGFLWPAAHGSLWRTLRMTPSFANGRDLGGALFVCAAFFLFVDARPAMLYYPIAIMGVAGLLLELALINLVLVLTVTRRLGVADTWRDAALPLAAALLLSGCELAFMSLIRHVTLGDVTRFM